MSEPSGPAPEQPRAEKSSFRRLAGVMGGGLGCLALCAGLALVAAWVLALFLDDPTFWIAAVAFAVAVSAYKAAKRGR